MRKEGHVNNLVDLGSIIGHKLQGIMFFCLTTPFFYRGLEIELIKVDNELISVCHKSINNIKLNLYLRMSSGYS